MIDPLVWLILLPLCWATLAFVLGPGRGAFVPPDNPQAFGSVLGHVLGRPDGWRHLREEAPVYAREWSDAAMARRMVDLYRGLTASPGGAGAPRIVRA